MLNRQACKIQNAYSSRKGSQQWHAFADARNRQVWRRIAARFQLAILDHANDFPDAWEILSARVIAEYARDGIRGNAELILRRRIDRIGSAALLWAMSGDDDWGDEVMDGLLLLMEQTSWCAPAHEDLPDGRILPSPDAPFLDLTAGYTAALVAYCDQIVGPWIEQRDSQFRARMGDEVRRRVLEPFISQDLWWMGDSGDLPNNWNPWIVSSVLAAAQSFASDACGEKGQASDLDQIIDRSLHLLDKYLSVCPDDGSCEEGTAYWWWAGSCLFDALRILDGCTGVTIVAAEILSLQHMPRFVRLMAVGDTWNLNFGDASALHPADARWHHLYQFANFVDDSKTAAFAKSMYHTKPVYGSDRGKTFGRVLYELFDLDFTAGDGDLELDADVWLPEAQIFAARENTDGKTGFHVGAKAGNNGVSHNHNDVGNFMISFDGEPVVIDIGAEEYNARTFSKDRYIIWTNRSSWHNVPLISGFEQSAGARYEARNVTAVADATTPQIRMDLAPAYPQESGIQDFIRSISLRREQGHVVVYDAWKGTGLGKIAWHLMVPQKPVVLASGAVQLSDKVKVSFLGAAIELDVEAVPVLDGALRKVWGEELFRLRLTTAAAPASGELRIVFRPTGG